MDAHWRDEDVMLGSQLVHVKRGQVLFSARKKAQVWGWSRNTSLDWFRFLEAHQMVSREVRHGPDGGYTLLTVLNYDKYQNPADVVEEDELSHELSHVRATLEPRTEQREEVEEEEEVKEPSPACGLTLAQYLSQQTPEDEEVLRQVVNAIASTRRCGKVADSVLNALARKLDQHPAAAVLSACRIYLEKNYATEGKREQYLLGIVRGEAKRQRGNGREPSSPSVGQKGGIPFPAAPTEGQPDLPYPNPMTEGQRAINRAWRDQQTEQESGR